MLSNNVLFRLIVDQSSAFFFIFTVNTIIDTVANFLLINTEFAIAAYELTFFAPICYKLDEVRNKDFFSFWQPFLVSVS